MSDAPQLDPTARRASRRIVAAQTASKLGDVLVDAKTVLTWLMTSVGAPAALIGVLVPIRESGSMLPQLWLTGIVRRFGRRKWAYFVGAVGQAVAVSSARLSRLEAPSRVVTLLTDGRDNSQGLSPAQAAETAGRLAARIKRQAPGVARLVDSLAKIARARAEVDDEGRGF